MADSHKPSKLEIEGMANREITGQLIELFSRQKNMELLNNPSQANMDWGIDFFMEAFNRADKSRQNFFFLQNKGSHGNFRFLKSKNQITFSISLWHAKYYYFLGQPLFMMFCDTTTKKVYWYSIQLDTDLEDKITNSNKDVTSTMQLHVPMDKILSADNFHLFLADLEKSETIQIYKRQQESAALKADYKLTERNEADVTVVDHIIRVLRLYEGIHTIPPHIITKISPFKGSRKTTLYGDTLSTDNVDFFDFMSNLGLEDGQITLVDYSVDYAKMPDFQSKIKEVLNFLAFNMIYHVEWSGKGRRDRICTHHLFTGNGCECERCTFRTLNLSEVENKLNSQAESKKIEHKLRKAYTYFLMADYYNSFLLHKEVLKELKIDKNPSLFTITKFNLVQLRNLVENRYLGQGRAEVLADNSNMISDEIAIQPHFLDIFRLIKNSDFINNALWKIDKSLVEIQKMWLSDQRGGSSNNRYADNLIIDFTRAYNFVEYNLLIYNDYHEFEVMVNKAIEGFLALHSIINDASSKYKAISESIIDKWLFHATPEHILHLFRKYNITSIQVTDKTSLFKELESYILNLNTSSVVIIKNFEAENYSHSDKIKQIISNYLLIISIVDLSVQQRNRLFGLYLQLITVLAKWHFTGFEYLNFFIGKNANLNLKNLKKTIQLLVSHNVFGHDAMSSAVENYLKNLKGKDIEATLRKLLKIRAFDATHFLPREKLHELVWVIPMLSIEAQTRIVDEVKVLLETDFDSELYYQFSAYDLIPFNEVFFNKFVKATPDLTKRPNFLGRKELKNYHLDRVVDQIFKFEIPITNELKELPQKAVEKEYYEWLLDIDNFDYLLFKPYWILHQNNINYTKAFRKSEKLKLAIATGLRKDYVEGVAKVFLRIYFPQEE